MCKIRAVFQRCTCKLVCVSITAKLLLHRSQWGAVSDLYDSTFYLQRQKPLCPDLKRWESQYSCTSRSCRMHSGRDIQHSEWLNMSYTQTVCILPWQACYLYLYLYLSLYICKRLSQPSFFCLSYDLSFGKENLLSAVFGMHQIHFHLTKQFNSCFSSLEIDIVHILCTACVFVKEAGLGFKHTIKKGPLLSHTAEQGSKYPIIHQRHTNFLLWSKAKLNKTRLAQLVYSRCFQCVLIQKSTAEKSQAHFFSYHRICLHTRTHACTHVRAIHPHYKHWHISSTSQWPADTDQ